jgi:hypothetical protein
MKTKRDIRRLVTKAFDTSVKTAPRDRQAAQVTLITEIIFCLRVLAKAHCPQGQDLDEEQS